MRFKANGSSQSSTTEDVPASESPELKVGLETPGDLVDLVLWNFLVPGGKENFRLHSATVVLWSQLHMPRDC